MSDKDIVKALECCEAHSCSGCPFYEYMGYKCEGADAQLIGLIKRQQSEIERLQNDLSIWKDIAYKETSYVEKARAEAIKEFTDRLKERIADIGNLSVSEYLSVVTDIDDLKREMAGAHNEN